MNFSKTLYLLLFLILPNLLSAQHFVYEYINHKINKSDDYLLTMDNGLSYFTTVSAIVDEEYLEKARKVGQIDMKKMNKTTTNYYVEKFKDEMFLYNHLLGAKVLIKMKASDLKWQLLNEKKKLVDKELHKATVQYGGRNWIAWYNPRIPIINGPYVFSGLPGLIEEIYDSEQIHHFTMKGKSQIKYNEKYIKTDNLNQYTKISEKNFFELLNAAKANPYEFQITHSEFLATYTSQVPEERKVKLNNFYRKKLENLTIEKE